METTARGRETELACQRYLTAQGLEPVTTNYRTRLGEIDLIMRDGSTIVFVEVRYRRSSVYGHAASTVGRSKQNRILLAAEQYIVEHDLDCPIRIDVVGMTGDDADGYEYDWIRNAISARTI